MNRLLFSKEGQKKTKFFAVYCIFAKTVLYF